MTPYNNRAIVIIDPNIKPDKLVFGAVPTTLYDQLGTIKDNKYLHNKRFTSYLVSFGKDVEHWFKESELVLVMS